MSIMPPASDCNHPHSRERTRLVVHVLTGAEPDGLCLVCDECDGVESHDGPHDCGHA